MAMDVVSVSYLSDITTRATRIHFELDIPVPPQQAEALKALMDAGDWNAFKVQAKTFAPIAVSGALDFLISIAPQKAPQKKVTPSVKPAP